MREPPPPHLTALLTRLGLATEADLESVEPAVQRMAGELPRFESIWIDALRQARDLTQFQASEIHAGRGESLRVARYVLCHSVHECGYATIYKAEEQETQGFVRLALFSPGNRDRETLLPQLERLIALERSLPSLTGMVTAGGLDGQRVWAASPWVEGTPLADFLLHHGRFPPEAVLEIARAMLGQLATLEAANLVHGDIRVQNVLISSDGDICIPHAGLRSIMRPQEGISFHDLAPDACSGLAPERVTEGTPPSVASDLFACGCVWWHMLCGRPPLGCGDVLARLRAAQAAAIDDLHRWAADIPDVLVEAIGDCLQKDPRKRPPSMADLARRLGPCAATVARPLRVGCWPQRGRGHLGCERSNLAKASARPIRTGSRPPRLRPCGRSRGLADLGRTKQAASTAQVAERAASTDGKPQAGQIAPAAARDRGNAASTAPGQGSHSGRLCRRDRPAAFSTGTSPSAKAPWDGLAIRPTIRGSQASGDELHLSSDRPIRGELLQLKPGQRVCGQRRTGTDRCPSRGPCGSGRSRIVREHRLHGRRAIQIRRRTATRRRSLVRLMAAQCNFVNCSFQSAGGNPEPSAAIVWQNASRAAGRGVALPSGRIRMKDCVLRRVAVGIESRRQGAIAWKWSTVCTWDPGR